MTCCSRQGLVADSEEQAGRWLLAVWVPRSVVLWEKTTTRGHQDETWSCVSQGGTLEAEQAALLRAGGTAKKTQAGPGRARPSVES